MDFGSIELRKKIVIKPVVVIDGKEYDLETIMEDMGNIGCVYYSDDEYRSMYLAMGVIDRPGSRDWLADEGENYDAFMNAMHELRTRFDANQKEIPEVYNHD